MRPHQVGKRISVAHCKKCLQRLRQHPFQHAGGLDDTESLFPRVQARHEIELTLRFTNDVAYSDVGRRPSQAKPAAPSAHRGQIAAFAQVVNDFDQVVA